ncbi:aminotransferase class V-fold PLP-dependent enzyme [Salibacterium salarium]|uniref:Aminotransferase class V-fold PLP-dependent enzyme n=2 Tax=Salibacterium salarium TaxID=284579 RepID=A0A428MZF7_9BACI|nr:aminotransferase class V-fold PLP-dependent enzyme [Salibacterium salarium]
MQTSVLPVMDVEEAKQKQFELVQAISAEFSGNQFFSQGDLGVVPGEGSPVQTKKVESTLASFFGTESCVLVRGAGTGAIREVLASLVNAGDSLFMHASPVYKTTQSTIDMMGLVPVYLDYNDPGEVKQALQNHSECGVFYVQHSRQKPNDHYDLGSVIQMVKELRPNLSIVVDDNYTVFKANHIGVELGAAYSCFSGFKLLGPPGIGIIAGRKAAIEAIQERNYSGGGQVQGYEAMELLRSLVTASVLIAVQNEETDKLENKLNQGAVPQIKKAYVTNSQSKNVVAEFKEPIADQVIKQCEKHGAAVYPVGAESRFEVLPMIYRVSGSFLDEDPDLLKTAIRINPMRADAELVIQILKSALKDITGKG